MSKKTKESVPYLVMPMRMKNKPRIIWTDQGFLNAIHVYITMNHLPGLLRPSTPKEGWEESEGGFRVLRIPKDGFDLDEDIFSTKTFKIK